MSEPRSLAIWTVGESNSTYFTIEGESLIDMMKNEIPINYWRVIHGKNDTTKPFITRHVSDDILFVIGEEEPMFKRLFKAHMEAIQ